MQWKHSRPSPALVVAVMALVAALAGTAVAQEAGTSAKPVTKKKVKKIADKRISKAAPGLAVASAGALEEVEYVRSDVVTVPAGLSGGAIATCPEGKVATGGGGAFPGLSGTNWERSYPSNGNTNQAGFTAWEFAIRNQGGQPRNIRAYVICVNANSTTANYTEGANPSN